jgi:hypothetical protein
MNAASEDRPHGLTDSHWFWGQLFSVMALAGTLLIAPKFDVRQRQVEGRFLGRQAAATERQQAAGPRCPFEFLDRLTDRKLGRGLRRRTKTTAAGVYAAFWRTVAGRPTRPISLLPNFAAQGQSVSRKAVAEVPLAGLSFGDRGVAFFPAIPGLAPGAFMRWPGQPGRGRAASRRA